MRKIGQVDYIVIDSDKPSYKDPPKEISYFAYKRINHFLMDEVDTISNFKKLLIFLKNYTIKY